MDEENGTVVNNSAVTDTGTSEATTEGINSSTADDQIDTSQQETEVTDANESEDTSEDTEGEITDETEAEKPKRGAEARKGQLNTEIRDLVAERNRLRSEVEQINAQAYQPATIDQLLETVNPNTGDYFNNLEAQVESMKQEREIEKYNNQVTESRLTLHTDAQRAISDFPMFDQESSEYDPQASAEVDHLLRQSLVFDQRTGQVIGSRIPVYQLYKSHAAAAKANERRAEMTAQRNAERQITNSDHIGGAQGKQKSFVQLSTAEMEARLRKQGHDV